MAAPDRTRPVEEKPLSLENVDPERPPNAEVVLRDLPAAVLLVAADCRVAGHNPAAARLLGDRDFDFTGRVVFELFAGADEGLVRAFVGRVGRAAPGESAHAEARLTHLDGLVRHVELLGANLLHNPLVGAIVLHLVDVTRYVLEREAANRDSLTGLPNRMAFQAGLEGAWRRLAVGSTGPLTLIFCDLDRFKTVNDCYGHDSGDALLVQVAHRLGEATRQRGSLARFGGDEFVVLLDDDTAWRPTVEAILAVMAEPFSVAGITVEISASLGVARATSPDGGPGRLVRDADVAMYSAKASGRGRWRLHDDTIQDPRALVTIAMLEAELLTDFLTGVGNMRALVEHLEQTYTAALRSHSPYVVVFIDGDRFGDINKQYGQDLGDTVVRAMAQGLVREVRAGDRVFRRGGDEFIVVLRDASVIGAHEWLDRVRDAFAGGLDGALPVPITVSAGLAAFDPEVPAGDSRDVMERAEQAMRRAKLAGGNRVVVA